MKQLKNGLNAVYYYDLPSMIDEGDSIASIIQKAQAIVEARKQNSGPLQKAKDNTLAGLEDLQQSLETLKENIGGYCEDVVKVNRIIEESNKILGNIPLFRTAAEVLCSRLSEGKIRIVSIGEKNQGKSLFNQIFTGLPKDSKILKVKAHNATKDCTGAVNTFYHKEGQTLPLIKVEFLTVKEIVDNIKSAIKLIQTEIKDSHWTLTGIDSIRDKIELKNFLANTNHQAVIANLTINPEIKSSLEQYFDSDNNLGFVDLLGKSQITVSENDVDEYNDMQHPSKHFLAVKKINVTLDLYREGLFQYFEVADTKGLSAEAGAVANQKLIYDVINESDAVLSIARTGGQQNWKIYTQALGDPYRNNQVFKEKHFAIINVEEGHEMESADAGAKFIDDQKLSDYCYIGRLWEDANTDSHDQSIPHGENPCIPKDFVDNLIIHMLGKIAKHITEIDNERIAICQQSGNTISGALSKLKQLLADIDYTPFDEDKLVKEKVREFCDSALKYIEEQQCEILEKKRSESDEEELDADLYYKHVTEKNNENRFASVYEILTGEQFSGTLPKVDDDDESDIEIEKAVTYLLQSEIVNNQIPVKLNNRFYFGVYANELVWAIRRVVLETLFEREKQHPIACKMKEDLFDKLWELFHLNEISGKPVKWDAAYVDEEIHEMKVLNNVYNKGVFSPFIKSEVLMTPYSFLKEYFALLSNNIDEDDEGNFIEKPELDDKLCHKAIEKEFAKLALREKIIDSIKNFPDYMETFCNNIIDAIGNFTAEVAKNGSSFYRNNIEVIASDQDNDRLQKSRNWEEVSRCKRSIEQYKFENLPLISINE